MSIVEDIKQVFTRRDNALHQLIVINVLVFAAVVVLKAVTFLAGAGGVFALVMRQIELSANLGVLLRHPWTVLTYAFTHQGFCCRCCSPPPRGSCRCWALRAP